jgi:molecular chaperone HtpG
MDTANDKATETLPFQAEMKQVLDLFIRSLYSSKEVFLRELVSNASDALDRRRFEALTQPELRSELEPEIRLVVDKQARTLTISDNGIGMSREEVISNIGTIARSGTRQLIEKIKASKSSDQTLALIGQFGVGFYSAFMVASQVTLVTRRAGSEQATAWESTGDGTYTVSPGTRSESGTTITLHLKAADQDDGMPDFTDDWVLERIVKQYSDFVRYPIRMQVTREEVERDEDGKPKQDAPTKTVVEDKTLNSMKAIWRRKQQEVTEDEYTDFYKHISHDWEKPQKTITLSAEGRLEYRALLFIPSRAPFDFAYQNTEQGLQLFAQNVKIVEKCKDLLPPYFRFVKGVVDSSDLSLNVSREMLQQDRQIAQIRKGLVKKLLDVLAEAQDKEPEVYRKIWDTFGRSLKEGAYSDYENRDKLLALSALRVFGLFFGRSREADHLQGVRRSHEGGPGTHLLPGRRVARSPRSLTPPRGVQEQGHRGAVPARSGRRIHDPVGHRVRRQEAEVSRQRLAGSGRQRRARGQGKGSQGGRSRSGRSVQGHPAAPGQARQRGAAVLAPDLVARLPGRRRRGLATARPHPGGQDKGVQRRILELNPGHAVVKQMKERFDKNQEDPRIGDFAELLLGQALLAEGGDLPDPTHFGQLLIELMIQQG